MATQLNTGFGKNAMNAEGMGAYCGTLVSAVSGYTDEFREAGNNLGLGLRDGIRNSRALAVAAAEATASAMLRAINIIFDTGSPSKEAIKIGKYVDQGLAIGVSKYTNLAVRSSEGMGSKVVDTLGSSISGIAAIMSEDMDTDPVIRPVVDLSNVAAGARSIGSMLSGRKTISVDSNRTKNLAGSISTADAERRKSGSAARNYNYDNSNSGNVTVNVDKLNANGEDDVRLLASEIARYNRRIQFGFGG